MLQEAFRLHQNQGFCLSFVSPANGASSIAYDVATGLPTLAFLLFLAWHAQASLHKLRLARSSLMWTYYSILWAVSLLNLLRCLAQIGSLSPQPEGLWNAVWLVNRFGMVTLEVSVIVFLLQGFPIKGGQALRRTLCASGSISLVDTIVKSVFIFVLHVPLFLQPGSVSRWKWGFWLTHSAVFAALYAVVLALPLLRRRDFLPRRVLFNYYVLVLLSLYLVESLGALLLVCRQDWGYCVHAWSTWLYWAGYPPLLYVTFLADFFADDSAEDLDQMYYEEMSGAAGFFEEEEADGVVY